MRMHLFFWVCCSWLLTSFKCRAQETPSEVIVKKNAEESIGERLFKEPRFAQFFYARCSDNVNMVLAPGDDALDLLAHSKADQHSIASPFAGQTMSCQVCHLGAQTEKIRDLPTLGMRALGDFSDFSPLPKRNDGRFSTPRNSPSLVDVVVKGASEPLHFDGEFATVETLIEETYAGRNFGWLPGEHETARRHFARVIREDDGKGKLARDYAGISYAVLLAGDSASIPPAFRLPEDFRINVAGENDDTVTFLGMVFAVSRLSILNL